MLFVRKKSMTIDLCSSLNIIYSNQFLVLETISEFSLKCLNGQRIKVPTASDEPTTSQPALGENKIEHPLC